MGTQRQIYPLYSGNEEVVKGKRKELANESEAKFNISRQIVRKRYPSAFVVMGLSLGILFSVLGVLVIVNRAITTIRAIQEFADFSAIAAESIMFVAGIIGFLIGIMFLYTIYIDWKFVFSKQAASRLYKKITMGGVVTIGEITAIDMTAPVTIQFTFKRLIKGEKISTYISAYTLSTPLDLKLHQSVFVYYNDDIAVLL